MLNLCTENTTTHKLTHCSTDSGTIKVGTNKLHFVSVTSKEKCALYNNAYFSILSLKDHISNDCMYKPLPNVLPVALGTHICYRDHKTCSNMNSISFSMLFCRKQLQTQGWEWGLPNERRAQFRCSISCPCEYKSVGSWHPHGRNKKWQSETPSKERTKVIFKLMWEARKISLGWYLNNDIFTGAR